MRMPYVVSVMAAWSVFVSVSRAESNAMHNPVERRSVSDYDVIWETHSNAPRNAMPIGNGDVGLSVWTQEGGDLLFYLGKTDSFGEQGRLLKLGRIRVHFEPNPFAKGKVFRQRLCLEDGTIRIDADDVKVAIWVDANRPVVHVDGESAAPFKQAVNARGNAAIKFNGGMFNVSGIDSKGDINPGISADARAWSVPFWFQNQRHIDIL